MKFISYIIIVFLVMVSYFSFSQTRENTLATNEYDKNFSIFDLDGTIYQLKDLYFEKNKKKTRGINPTYTAGIFKLHFDDAGTNTGFDDATMGLQRVNVAIQVFTDISNLLNEAQSPYSNVSNLGIGNSFVEIHVNTSLNTSSNPTLGTAGQFFMTSSNGIVHGAVWQTINTGIDSWLGVNATNIGNTGIYHGLMTINFGHNYYTGSSASGIGATQIDLYSVILHEVLHSLGIGSLINSNGASKLTNTNPGIYSIYDTYLTNITGTKLITWNNCYNASFNTANTNLLTTPCSIKYASTSTLFVSSDAIWSGGTSLSHFPNGCSNTGNFVMTPGMSAGTTKRFPDEIEIQALCTLGYSTSGVYPGTTYTSASICGNRLAGTNDTATYTTSGTGSAYIVAANTSLSISSTDFLGNDENATYYSCLEVVNGSGTLSGNLSGIAGNNITFTPNTNYAGTAILKYIPKQSATGISGNITYIFITVTPPPLPPCGVLSACEMMCYGGFEEFTSQAQYDAYTLGGYTSNNNVSFSFLPATYPDNSPDWQNYNFILPPHINCGSSGYSVDAHTGTNCIRMILRNSTNGNNNPEGPALPLVGSVQPGESVTIKLWARVGSPACNGGLELRLTNKAPCTGNQGYLLSSCIGLVQTPVVNTGAVNGLAYSQYTISITNNSTVPMTHLLINSLPFSIYSAQPFGFIFVDDISVIKNLPVITLTKTGPNNVCSGDTIAYTIKVKNNSSAIINNLQLKDSLGTGLSYTSGGTFTSYPTFTIPSIAANTTNIYTLKAIVNASFGNVKNTVWAITNACISDTSVTQTSAAINNQNISYTTTSNKSNPCAGDTITMTMTVCNYNTNALNNINLQTVVPTGYLALAGTGYTISGNTIIWNVLNFTAATATNPSCYTLTYKVKIGTTNGNICTKPVVGSISCINASHCFTVDITKCIPELVHTIHKDVQISVYPNPAKEIIFFEIKATKKGMIQLKNVVGQILMEKEFDQGSSLVSIDVSSFANATILYSIIMDNKIIYSNKFSKQH